MAFEGANKDVLNTNLGIYENMLKVQYVKNDYASAHRFSGDGAIKMIKAEGQGFKGKNLTMDVELGGSSAHSSDFGVAQALSNVQASNEPGTDVWIGNNADYNVVHQIKLEDMLRADDSKASFLKRRSWGLQAAMDAFWQDMASVKLWGPGRGAFGRVRAIGANATKTLSKPGGGVAEIKSTHEIQVESPEQLRCLSPGTLITARAPGGNFPTTIGTNKAMGQPPAPYGDTKFVDSAVVVAVDHGTTGVGTKAPKFYVHITTGANAPVMNDVLFKVGDNKDAAKQRYMSSIPEWIPVTAPGSTAFFNIDRTRDPVRLSGFRETLTGDEDILKSVDKMYVDAINFGRKGVKPDCLWMNDIMERALINQLGGGLGNTITYPTSDKKEGGERIANVGYAKLNFHTKGGILRIYLDPNCPATRLYLLHMPSVRIKYLGPKLVFLVMGSETKYTYLKADQNAYETRWNSLPNLMIGAPGKCGVIETKDKTGFWQT